MDEIFSGGVVGLVTAAIILVVGWLLAIVLSAVTRKALRRTSLDDRIADALVGPGRAADVDAARVGGRIVYYTVLLFTALAFFQSLSLTAAARPINAMLDSVFAFLPRLLGAVAIGAVAYLVATLARRVVRAAAERWEVDARLRRVLDGEAPDGGASPPSARGPVTTTLEGPQVAPAPGGVVDHAVVEPQVAEPQVAEQPGTDNEAAEKRGVGATLADVAFWLVMLLFVPAILGTLQMQGILAPVEGMMDDLLAFLPRLASAALIFGVGFFVARILQRVVSGVARSAGLDRLSVRTGIERALGGRSLAALLGVVVFALVLLPVAIAALDALALESVTTPATSMLHAIFGAVPLVFAAALLLGIAYLVARLCASLVENVASAAGFDAIPERLGLRPRPEGATTPSAMLGKLTLVAIVYFAAMEAARLVGFETLAGLAAELATLAGHILLGLAILGVGLYLANLAASFIERSEAPHTRALAIAARITILVLVAAMALRQMGIANEIVELAFGLTLGAVAVAGALAFGLGGRNAAGRLLDEAWRKLDRRETYAPPAAEPGVAE
ncbi:MAG: mechanosensitive ion channel [Myxococcota bacterium]|nr:mechanosensitive ion channel [Myxococcota bacterium]